MSDKGGDAMTDLGETVVRFSEQVSGIERRLDNLEKLTESVNKMALSLERLTTQQNTTEERIARMADDVDEMKSKPAKRWDAVVAALIAGVVGAFLGHFL